YFIPNPVEDYEWVQDRKMTIKEAKGTPMYRPGPLALKLNQQKPPYLIGEFREHESRWSFRPQYGSIHVSRWKSFGEKLKTLIRVDGSRSIPRHVQDFFGLFQG